MERIPLGLLAAVVTAVGIDHCKVFGLDRSATNKELKKHVDPNGDDTKAQAREEQKAMVQKFQEELKATAKVHSYPKPREAKLVMAATTLYNRRLVAVPDLDRSSYCALRDGYEVEQFTQMMLQLWRGDFPVWHKRKTYTRDRLSINWRHHMLLRDEDHHGASVHVRGLVICLRGGKTRSDLNSQYSVALRHNNFARCPVGAFDFIFSSVLK
ncbi:hypothetical protein BGZ95_011843 [Linnemannia exigua]|uniref:Uncharacterized protein n=1 Tax=Linnemannia exigua TaxID=604196 RepID=A0AAD4H953_9FUNG|nr:hypothetical protein BGZ95_011843 [Linnemannia exigua]